MPQDARSTSPGEERASTAPLGRVLVEPVPTQPADVRLAYPDGTELPVACHYGGTAGTRQKWIAVVPREAHLANGMVIRVNRDVVLAVALHDRPAPT